MLRIYYGDVSALPTEAGALPLSAYRLSRLRKLIPPEKRRQSIGAELLLIRALQDLRGDVALPLEIEADELGKPHLKGDALYFSLSHSGDYSACALSDRPVGLDLERQRPIREEMVRRFYAQEEERVLLASSDRDSAVTELWTRKESVLKATGKGLSFPLAEVDTFSERWRGKIWHQAVGEMHFAVCTLEGDPTPDALISIELP